MLDWVESKKKRPEDTPDATNNPNRPSRSSANCNYYETTAGQPTA